MCVLLICIWDAISDLIDLREGKNEQVSDSDCGYNLGDDIENLS